MKSYFKRIFSAMLAIILVVSIVPNGIFKATATAASAQSTITTGSIVTYGSYPQSRVYDSTLITTLNLQTLQADGNVTYNGSKYKRVFFTTETNSYQATNGYNRNTVYWFKFEPIQWRVLSNTNGELFVLAEKILESRPYNWSNADVTWETCTIRSRLNNDFYNTAFNSLEKSRIKTSTVINADNPSYGTEGGNDTSDKLFLLSYADTINTAYGFNSSYSATDTARMAQGTDFSKSNGLFVSTHISYLGNSVWWLRTPGYYSNYTCYVYDYGTVYGDYHYYGVYNNVIGVRPAFKINLSSVIFTSSSNSGCVVDYENMTIYGLAAGVTSLTGYVNVASGYELSYVPTSNGFGTSTVANFSKDGTTLLSYKIVIYGDVNGDGNIDSIDAGKIVDFENAAITWDITADAVFYEAGDLNGDGNVDSMDAGIAVDMENDILFVNQSTGTVSVITAIAGSVVITGLPDYGNTLTADTTGITPTGATLTYIWKRSGVVIGTDKTYVVTAADIGKSITVTVTGVGAYSESVRSLAVTPSKADTPTPVSPTLFSKTPNSITLNAVTGQEYKIDSGEWQLSAVFTGLNANTSYSLYTRVAETDTHNPSGSSTALSVTTYEKDLSGTVAITGTAKFGATLMANITDVKPITATLDYQWKRGEVNIGSESTYTIAVEDIGQPITLTITGTGIYVGCIISTAVVPTKANVATPVTPTMQGVTSSTVTLNAVAGQEYKVNSGAWQSSAVFTGLNKNTAYSFYTRVAETATHNPSASSTALSVTTSKVTITGTVVITGSASVGQTLTADITGIIPNDATLTYKWKSDGVQVGTASTYLIADADIGTKITVTVTGTVDYLGSVTSAATGTVV